MALAIFIVYFILFSWLVTRVRFFTKSGLYKPVLIGLFVIKVFAGVVYAWFYSLPQYIAGSDTWRFFEASKAETDFLLNKPFGFFADIFHYGYKDAGNIFTGRDSYWNDLKSNIVIKIMAVCNVFTFKNYYADIVFFNFAFFFGPVAFYRVMQQAFSDKKIQLVLTVFLLPSFIFWCSGVHKDGFIFLSLALLIYYFNQLLNSDKLLIKPLLVCAFSYLLLFAMRNVICLLLLPALLTWFLCARFPKRKVLWLTGVYGACLLLFFSSAYITPSVNLPAYAAAKQQEFIILQGGSQIKVKPLQPSFIGFVQFLPTALDIALLRPHISEMRNLSYLPAIVELFLLWFLTGLFLFSKKNYPVNDKHIALVIFCLCFAFSYLLLNGYIVTFSGAIVRYKSIVLPLLFCPLICITNINKEMITKR